METKIKYGHEANIMKKFKFMEQFGLSPMVNGDPVVVFGCYNLDDVQLILSHKNTVVVVWMGEDSLFIKDNRKQKSPSKTIYKMLNKPNIIHTTWVPPIQRRLIKKGLDCKLLKITIKENAPVQPLGTQVYTYLQKKKPEYHGSKMVDSLNLKDRLLVGDYSISREDWYAGENDKMYSNVFIGLALSKYAGGLMSIVEMGVRGIPVVTNIIDLPHCIPWETKEDIEQAIEHAAKNIGKKNTALAKAVRAELAPINGCFDLEKLLIK